MRGKKELGPSATVKSKSRTVVPLAFSNRGIYET